MFSSTTTSLFPLRLQAGRTLEELSATATRATGISSLTRRLAAGEEDAFAEFHRAYFDRLYRLLLVITRGQEDEAREALQQTLLRVLRYARVFESEDTFWAWLTALARSAARDVGRKQQRYAALLQRFALNSINCDPNWNENTDERLRAILEETLNELGPQERQLLEDKYLDGTTVRELSFQTGATEKALESRLLRLRRQVRKRILEKLNSV